jgi:hypothetical protein
VSGSPLVQTSLAQVEHLYHRLKEVEGERDRLAARAATLEARRAALVDATRRLIRNVESENFKWPARSSTMSEELRAAIREAGEAIGAALAESPDRGEQ